MPVETFASTGVGQAFVLYLGNSGQNPSFEDLYCLPIRVTSVP